MSTLPGPSYSGPTLGQQVNTKAEVEAGQVKAPVGTTEHVVLSGENLSQIAHDNKTTVAQLLEDNPQYSLNPQQDGGAKRDADLIYPGEVIFVRPGTAEGVPQNGTVATGAADGNGQTTFQDYRNGEASGKPYQATAAPNGQPADKVVVDANGGEIRTGGNGEPVTGWVAVDSSSSGKQYQYFVSGRATTDPVVNSQGEVPKQDPPKQEKDALGKTIETGWYVVAQSSQGVRLAYFENGHRIDAPLRESGRTGDPPPNISSDH